MANPWGDAPVLTAPDANEWGDAPASPYAALIAEAESFGRRAGTNTPEAIGRRALVDDEAILASTPIPTGLGFNVPLSLAKPIITNTPRVALPLGTALAATGIGTLPGAALVGLAGLAGEVGSEALEKGFGERESFSVPQIATNTLLSVAPPLRLAGIASPIVRGGLRAAEGAGYGALAPTLEAGFRGDLPQIQDVKQGALFGGILGAPFGAAELAGGRLVAGRPATAITPTELGTMGQVLNESRLPQSTDILPTELDIVNQAEAISRQEQRASQASAGQYSAGLESEASQRKIRALGERMMGVSEPEQKLQILDQELRLQKDTLTLAEQRAGLDMKLALKQQVDQQKALEKAASDQQRAAKDAERAAQDQQAAIAESSQPPEIPKSAQILAEPTTKPPSIANVATEVATQTENSPFALQNKLNELTAGPQTNQQAGRPPVETDPTKIASDRTEYERIQGEMRKKEPLSDEYNALWQASEDIKNRHGGMVPEKISGQEPVETLAVAGGAAQGRTGPSQEVVTAPTPIAPRAPIQPGEVIEAAVSRLAAGGETALAIAARVNSDTATVRKIAMDNGIAIAEKSKVKPDIVMTPRSAEQRLNDADLNLPPVSSLSRAQKRAELDAAGVTTYKGKPLDDINPAELSSAVGKLRRGESLDLPPTDIIDRLTKAKIKTAGRAFDATAGIPIAAYNAAIDTAIVAIRAGRALAEVVAMAIDRYRKLHPRATDEEITRLSQDIEVAHGLGDPTPGRTEAEQIVADAPALDAATGRSPEATQAASRLRQTRASIPASVLAPLGGGAAGGAIGYTQTERLPGESDEAYNARRIQNAIIGSAAGGATGASVSLLSRGAKVAQERARVQRGGKVDLPTPGAGQGIRQTAEKVIENRSYPEQLRQVLADDPEILYNKISRNRIRELTKGATDEELVVMVASPDDNIRIGALIQQANRAAVTPGMEKEGARLIKEVAKNFTSPAQILGLGNLVENPQAMVDAVMDTLRQSVPRGTKIPTLSPQAQAKLFDLATNNIRSEQRLSAAERAARDNFTPATKAEYLSARNEAGSTRKALADYTKDILPERFGEIVSKIIKGNLLAPLSFAKNAFGNAAWQGLLRGSETIATGLDAVYSQATKKPRVMALGSPIPGKEELEAFGQGVKIAGKELLTGPGTESYIKSEVQRGFHPVRAMLQVFSGLSAAERIMERRGIASLPENSPKSARVKKFIEATLGITPEASFRLLNMGDKPVRMAVEQRILSEQANLRGLRGTAREQFMLLPDAPTQGLVELEGLGGVLAQENKLAVKVGKIFDSGLVDLAESMRMGRSHILEDINKIAGTLAIPYRQFPANFAITAANFALPPVAFARAALQARSGNRREALRNVGEGIIGAMFLSSAGYLWDKGLISEPADPRDKKRRSAQYETMGAQRINLSGLERLRNGGDPTYRRGDDTRDWSTIGPAAASFYVFTKAKSKDLNKAARTGDAAEDRSDLEVLLNVTDAAGFAFDQSFLSGTSAFIDALQDWDNYGDRFIQNTFRAVTSTVAPNSLEAFARTNYKFIPEQKGDNLRDTLKNVWDYKTMQLSQDERSNYKRDFWGNPITRTQAGQNPYVAQFVDVTKAETKQPDPFKQALLNLYQQTRSTDVYPALVTNRLTVSGDGGSTTVELTPSDYDDLQDFVGQAREDYAKRIVADSRFTAPNLIPEQKILALNAAYTEGAKLGKAMLMESVGFKERYPELFGQPSGKESRVISRDTKARGVLRMQRENEWGDEPVGP